MSFIDNSGRNKMGKKYLDTKEGSLEQSILGVWQTAIEEKDARMDGRTKEYREHRAKLEAARKTRSEKLVGGQKKLDKDKDGDIDAKDFAMLRKAAKKDKKEEVEVKEGKMSQLHQLMKDGKTAEEIAKIMRVDAKTIKKLMDGHMKDIKEYYEIGTDEYRKHTEDVTPGENGEWAKHVGEKSQSMREALAKVWGVSEGKSPFKKEEKKSLTKEVKDGKTMTGKKIASVDINPSTNEKVK